MKLIKKKAKKTGVYLDESELERWTTVQKEFNNARLHLADLEMQKTSVAYQVAQIEQGRKALINELVTKYGEGKDIKIFPDGKVEIANAED